MRKFLALAAVSTALAAPALAQDLDDTLAAARNQLGLLEYCQAEGHIDGTAVETQAGLLAQLPPATDAEKVDAAYEKGKAGTLSAMGIEQNLADAATTQNTSVAEICTQMAVALAAAAAQTGG
ncbi:pore-forming ESAT-6 family protein [Pseudogemmobacter humi]|uniref:Uncharacterized protein n=1 Tax=Pseudogemmobacter humi TaxID=2483812 RepID=A0A3P5WLU3_9RHOB|nr:pore-forming ESAT-6 family protein [Pseudogemmobacter humi]VDC24513.1 hypothetical protein XINFAN_01222 [Pseudogemmobacter humi]